jgi:hypothetical protein
MSGSRSQQVSENGDGKGLQPLLVKAGHEDQSVIHVPEHGGSSCETLWGFPTIPGEKIPETLRAMA